MNVRHTPWHLLAAAASACLLVAGCSDSGSGSSDEPDAVDLEPLTGITSPDTSVPPSGSVVPSPSGLHSTTFEPVTRSIVALDDARTALTVFDADDAAAPPRSVPLSGAAADVVPGVDGTLLLPMNGSLAEIDLRSSGVRNVDTGGNLLSAATLSDGTVVAGDDSGSIHIVDFGANRSQSIGGLTSVDALASTEHGLAALDRHQTSLTQVNVADESLGLALRAGTGAARLDTDEYGRILVTDAAGGELLVYSSDDLLLRQRFPVGAQPWAVTYDDKSDTVWVTTPADNEVVGYTLDTGIPVESGRFSTVRQPDSITVDPDSGALYVGSATGGGLQRIDTAERG
ncbi:hypothetical protein CH300_22865 [Rhodococcus sp. 15-1154-1]|nr:hypothetical protein [Rhodococcus sp. 15-1154-1]OZE98657.1 hypothetical protein CH300_22865 [Rhodococcus sp. 15-1154-1]